MKQLYSFFIPAIVLLMLQTGCSSGKKALERGDYDQAVALAVNRLRANDDHKKARHTLDKAYNYAVEMHVRNIERSKKSTDPLKWESIVYEYRHINHLYDEILRCPGCRDVVPNPVKYDAELASATRNAAEVRYKLGNQALQQKQNRAMAIEAHQHFLKVQNLVPRFKDVDQKLSEALSHATLRVVVEPIPAPVRSLNISHEFFVNKINEYLHNRTISDYVRFYTPQEAQAQRLPYVDHVIDMEFDRFSLGNVFLGKESREVSKDSVVIQTRGEEKIYGTVKATITVHEKSITGQGLLDFKIRDNELKKVISQEKFPSQYTWTVRWANFNGDERALSDEDLALVNRIEAPIPNPQWMFEEFTAPLYDQVIGKLTHFYQRY